MGVKNKFRTAPVLFYTQHNIYIYIYIYEGKCIYTHSRKCHTSIHDEKWRSIHVAPAPYFRDVITDVWNLKTAYSEWPPSLPPRRMAHSEFKKRPFGSELWTRRYICIYYVDLIMLVSLCWLHYVDLIMLTSCWPHYVDLMLTSLCWPHYVGLIMLTSLCWPHCVDLIMLDSLCWPHCVHLIMLTSLCWPHYVDLIMMTSLCWTHCWPHYVDHMLTSLCWTPYVDLIMLPSCWPHYVDLITLVSAIKKCVKRVKPPYNCPVVFL